MTIYNNDFIESVSGQFVQCFLQGFPNQFRTVGNGSWLVFGFVNLTEIIPGIDNRIFFSGCTQSKFTGCIKIGSQGEMRSVFFKDPDGQDTGF